MQADFKRVKEIFLAAVETTGPDEREDCLRAACGADESLRRQVEALLRRHEDAGSFLESPVVAPAATDDSRPHDAVPHIRSEEGATSEGLNETIGSRIGPYKLVQQLGEGGMGTVWLAEQTEPVKRRVALKLIKPGMDSAQVLRRFEAERQALALMDHSNIAKVLDAGTVGQAFQPDVSRRTEFIPFASGQASDDANGMNSVPSQAGKPNLHGRPYFVMELVKGVPITRYCDELRLSLGERLALFVPVCQAIQHAHQKGIIHRDIKPTNVLVAMQDGQPVPKVIDFGVAKALHQRLTDDSLHTEVGQIVGTLEYMSPEQAELSPLDIDTRADVYALGVLLYELLTGTTPLDRKRLKQAAYSAMLRMIREVEPPKPSTRLSELSRKTESIPFPAKGETADNGKNSIPQESSLASIAAMRQTEPTRLASELRGELDWIAMKCLEKDRTRRYESASGLARDVERYLRDETVEACPPSTRYRMRKFLRKHRAGVLTTAALLGLLLAGVAASTWQAVRATAAEVKARDKELEALAAAAAERTATKTALAAAAAETAERKQAEAVADLLESVFRGLDPTAEKKGGLPLDKQLVAQLDAAAASLDEEYTGQPLVRARLRRALGSTQMGLGEPNKAVALFEKSLEERQRHLGRDHPDTLVSLSRLASAYEKVGQLDKALPLFEESARLVKAKFGPGHPNTVLTTASLAMAYQTAGRLGQSEPMWEELLERCKASLGPDDSLTLITMGNLAFAYQMADKLDKALPLFEETVTRMASLHPDDFLTLTNVNNLAKAYQAAGRPAKALPLLEANAEKMKARFSQDHPDAMTSVNNLGLVYLEVGRVDEALALLEDALQKRKAKYGPDHSDTLVSMHNLALAYHVAGQSDKAVPLFEETVQKRKAKQGGDDQLDSGTLKGMSWLGTAYLAEGQLGKALRLLEETLKLQTAKLRPDSPDTPATMNNLGRAYRTARRFDLSVPLFARTLEKRTAKLGGDHPDSLDTQANLGINYIDAGRVEEGIELVEQAVERARKLPDGFPFKLAWVPSSLAETCDRAGRFTKSEPLYRRLLADAQDQFGHDHPRTAAPMASLSQCLLHQQRYAEAEPILRECLLIREKSEPDVWTTFDNQSMLGDSLLGQQKFAEAEAHLLAGYEGLQARQEKIPPVARIRLTEAIERLVRLYETTGEEDKADVWRKKLAETTAEEKPKP